MLAQILALVLRVLGQVGTILSITALIHTITGGTQTTVDNTAVEVAVIDTTVTSPTNGMVATFNATQDIITALAADRAAILAAIANLTNGTTPVSLPPTPPPGYSAPTSTANANAVWQAQYPLLSGNIMGDQMNDAAYGAQNLGTLSRLPYPYNAYVQRHFDYSREDASPNLPTDIVIDPTTILTTDADVVAWLNRTVTGYTWTLLGDLAVSYSHTQGGDDWWVSAIQKAEFTFWRAYNATVATLVPPVWPGLANVTLGTPLTLANGLLVPGPLDGVVIAITSTPTPISFYPFGPLKSFVHVGGIAFVDDNGDSETVQPIGLSSNVVCPRSMTIADRAYIRLQSGVVGTVTPWLRV
jgi:hypothetical protein